MGDKLANKLIMKQAIKQTENAYKQLTDRPRQSATDTWETRERGKNVPKFPFVNLSFSAIHISSILIIENDDKMIWELCE